MKKIDYTKIEKSKLQYFSKMWEKWIDFKEYDCALSLQKYNYQIRIKPDANK